MHHLGRGPIREKPEAAARKGSAMQEPFGIKEHANPGTRRAWLSLAGPRVSLDVTCIVLQALTACAWPVATVQTAPESQYVWPQSVDSQSRVLKIGLFKAQLYTA